MKKSKKSCTCHDMTYWLGAMRVTKKTGGRVAITGRRVRKTMKKLKNTLAKGMSLCTKGVTEQIQKEFEVMNDFLFINVRSSSGTSRVVSGRGRMADTRSKKSTNLKIRASMKIGESTSHVINVIKGSQN